MRKVYAIWFLKRVAPAVFLYVPFLVFIALRETARQFFVVKIIDNFLLASHQGVGVTAQFVFSAIRNIPIFSSTVILFSLVLSGVILYRLIRNFKSVQLAKSY
jgi:hypothetical protein